MFSKIHLITILSALTALLALPGQSADLLSVPRVQVSTNNANFDLSVFDGAAAYNDRGIGGAEPGTPTFTNTFGDGTVQDYNFFHSPSETMVSYASSGAGLIADATCPPENINGAGENWSNVWTTTDPAGFTTTKDFTNGAVPNTFARSAEVDGTIDISTLAAGQIYFLHGTFVNNWTITVTMSGPGQPDVVASETQGANGPSQNLGWVSEFTFSGAGLYDTITYNYTNGDRDGSRARFMGVIIDGPDDTDGDGLTDLWEDKFFGDNSGTVEPSDLTATDGTGDADGDGLTDQQEHDAGSDPTSADGDGDNLSDADEINIHGTDPANPDTDGDGLNDDVEVAGPTDPLDPDSDDDDLNDGGEAAAGTDPLNPDSDGDGFNDGFEVANAASGFDPLVDDSSEDPDGDGLDNAAELAAGTDPIVADTDGDGDTDGEEVNGTVNPYTGGVSGPTPGDSTDPLNPDSDGDGVSDGDETDAANGSVTDPNNTDTDGDGFDDDAEITLGTSPTDPGDFPTIVPPDASLTWDASQDTGGDNFWPTVEFPASTVMRWAFDGGATPTATTGVSNFSGVTAWFNSPAAAMESFNDGEFNTTFTQPTNKDASFELVFRPGDLVDNHLLFETGGNGDGMGFVINGDTLIFRAQDANSDAQRIALSHTFSPGDENNFHHIVATLVRGATGTNMGILYVNGTEVDSAAATGAVNDWAGGDNSGLGRLNGSTATGQTGFAAFTGDIAFLRFWTPIILTPDEVGAIYDAISAPPPDDDSDGLPDPWEILHFGDITSQDGTGDPDGDGLNNAGEFDNGTDPNNPDTDGDGLNDGDELTAGTDPFDPDSDGDGLLDGAEVNTHSTDPLNPDSDGDSSPDGQEIADGTDPNDPLDPVFFQTFDFDTTDDGFTESATGLSPIPAVYDNGLGTWSFDGDDSGPATNLLTSPAITMPATGGIQLFLTHRYSIEADWDGVAVQFSRNGGPFQTVPITAFTANGYDFQGLIGNHILSGGDGFNGDSPGYAANEFVTAVANLPGAASGDTFQIQIVGGWDEGSRGAGIPNYEVTAIKLALSSDTDGDGIPDHYEDATPGLDKTVAADGATDLDGDGLSNLDEYLNGTDPNNTDTDGDGTNDTDELNGNVNPYTSGVLGATPGDPTNPLNPDSDGDGVTDGDETDNTNGSVSNPNNHDTDEDGAPDAFEIANGTDPTDPGDKPIITRISSLGTGAAALLGGDITDPENDGNEAAGPADPSWNWASIASTDEPGFGGGEFSYNIFDNLVGGGAAKWCCNTPDADGHQVTVTFKSAYNLTHFTVTSGNDSPGRDPSIWSIQGSNDGTTWTDIYPVPGSSDDPSGGGSGLWSARNEVLRFDLPDPSAAYTQFRYNVEQVVAGPGQTHQLNEIELFGDVDDTDTDGDGIPDWYRDRYAFLDPGNPNDGALDQDGDMIRNFAEFAQCLDPETASPSLVVTGGQVTQAGGPTTVVENIPDGVDFTVIYQRVQGSAGFGLQYDIEFSHNLVDWFPSGDPGTVIAAGNGFEVVEVPYPFFLANGRKARWWRLVITNAP